MGRPDLNPAVIIDNGTGFTKMGLSGNVKPSYIIPTCVGYGASPAAVRRRGGIEDLDFAIGYDALVSQSREDGRDCLTSRAIVKLMPGGIGMIGIIMAIILGGGGGRGERVQACVIRRI